MDCVRRRLALSLPNEQISFADLSQGRFLPRLGPLVHSSGPFSRRVVGRDFPDLRRERVFGRFEIEARLNVHSERRTGVEELPKSQRSVGRHRLFLARDALDPGARHVQCGRVRCQLERNKKFLPQNFTGMNKAVATKALISWRDTMSSMAGGLEP